MAKQEETIEYIEYQEPVLPNAEDIQGDFQYWKGIEKLDANIALRNAWSWWSVSEWWDISWTLSNQTDLQAELDLKVNTADINTNPYWRDDNGYFQLPVWTNMYP